MSRHRADFYLAAEVLCDRAHEARNEGWAAFHRGEPCPAPFPDEMKHWKNYRRIGWRWAEMDARCIRAEYRDEPTTRVEVIHG